MARVRKINIAREVRRIERCLEQDERPCEVCQRGILWSLCTGPLREYFELAAAQDRTQREIDLLESWYRLEDPRPM